MKQRFHQRLNETLFLLKASQRAAVENHWGTDAVFSLPFPTHSFTALSLLSCQPLLCSAGNLAQGRRGVLRGDLGLVNTSIINLNRNEPGQLWRHLHLEGSGPAVNLRHSVLHCITHSKSITTYIFPPARLTAASLCCPLSVLHRVSLAVTTDAQAQNQSDGIIEEGRSRDVCCLWQMAVRWLVFVTLSHQANAWNDRCGDFSPCPDFIICYRPRLSVSRSCVLSASGLCLLALWECFIV